MRWSRILRNGRPSYTSWSITRVSLGGPSSRTLTNQKVGTIWWVSTSRESSIVDRLLSPTCTEGWSDTTVIAGLSGLLIKDSTNIDPGRIINISSIAGLSPFAEDRLSGAGMGTYSYAVSKAAVNHLTSIMAAKFAKHHVTWVRLFAV